MSDRQLVLLFATVLVGLAAAVAVPGGAIAIPQQPDLDPHVAQQAPPPTDAVDPQRCVGRGPARRDGLMAAEAREQLALAGTGGRSVDVRGQERV